MNFQGGLLRGTKYGSLSPVDIQGLTGWWRSTDKITFKNGSFVKSWGDMSGKELTFLPTSTDVVGQLVSYNGRLGFTRGTVSSATPSDNQLDFLLNGSPYSFILISNSSTRTGNNILRYEHTPIQTITDRWNHSRGLSGGTNNAYQLDIYNSIGDRRAFSIATGAKVPENKNVSHVLNFYGANSSEPFKYESYANGVLDVQTNVTTNYTIRPDVTGNLALLGGFVLVYEMMFFNHTGKSASQIKDEMSRLYSEYISVRYPDLNNL